MNEELELGIFNTTHFEINFKANSKSRRKGMLAMTID